MWRKCYLYSKTLFPTFLNSDSGSCKEWVFIPNTLLPITSVVNLAQRSLASKVKSSVKYLVSTGLISSPQAFTRWNIDFIFPLLNVLVNLIRRFLQSFPSRENIKRGGFRKWALFLDEKYSAERFTWHRYQIISNWFDLSENSEATILKIGEVFDEHRSDELGIANYHRRFL